MQTPAQNARLALLLEVAGTPKPGNVDRRRDLADLRFEHFLAGTVGTETGLEMAQDGEPVGRAFERAVKGMAAQGGDNTQFGALLLLVPLVRAAADHERLSPSAVDSIVEETTVADAAGFYRAFDHVDVFVADPPEEMEPLDVRRGSNAVPELEDRGLTLSDVMDRSVPGDDVAREWGEGFERSFAAADRLVEAGGPATDRAASVFLSLLADRPDTLVANRSGEDVAREVSERADELVARNALETDRDAVESFAADLVDRGINPGTTADVTAAGLYIALERGEIEV
ncbi:triphosphoribosyl-dephospho-CoA synthase [Natronobacterium gregoryi]|uniref:Triphosphoribosyl-dephospho-CoA protein n=2 Tax=Natronobacterium gregoryi TaxID=44930 RepID=L0ALW2_NATGS|nr:triphosphoribosyl-dephospho-CoA synthase [Natronobacterium gregoryi]AFZ74883.1 Triphosphoribosyl-dephospho-CoA synthetase [Natronobacterium gregoryi SP2]ELY73301.1 triphosphoribosyl-dephospho-CoA protein [Natronobacterium gregoryi SP2]PLK19302.1 triphosphoribosyl-dephospho-CoA synthase [Natronobacterium gregoryi SP2]SFJ53100.1 triphosphoribosyl-dephospho-CoA synthase [Natronobacterium gregoryi]